MGSLTGLSDLVNRLTGGNNGAPEFIWSWKDVRTGGAAAASVVAHWCSLWQQEGIPGHGAAPGASPLVPTNTTDGGLKQTNPGGGRQKYLVSVHWTSTTQGTLLVYDRLLHISSLSGTGGSPQTVGGSLTRYTDGVGNQAWVEIYTAVGATSRTYTMSYSNTTPTSGRTTQPVVIGNVGFSEAQRMLPANLQLGDTGVSAVASLTLSASTGTAGDVGVTILHPLMLVPAFLVGTGVIRDGITQLPGLPEVKTDACLALALLCGANGTCQHMATFSFMEV